VEPEHLPHVHAVDVVGPEDEDVLRVLVGDDVSGSGRWRRPTLNHFDTVMHLRRHRLQ
jgi:hypothetical protein